MFPDEDDDGAARMEYAASLDREIGRLFKQPNVRAAAWALAEELIRTNEIDGPAAEILIDQYLDDVTGGR